MDQISSGDAFAAVEFAENPEPRVPCVLIVDTSTSMQGPRIDELNKGLKAYKDELLADPLASKRVEVAIVTFGGRVTRLVEFVTATKFEPPTLQPIGGTPMGEAISTALDMIEERKASYRQHGIAYYRPWAFLITDGEPNDHSDPVYDRDCTARLADLDRASRDLIAAMAASVPRIERYRPRLARAAACVANGDTKRFTGVMCESFHDIWMEWHEDLIVLQRIDRVKEGSF